MCVSVWECLCVRDSMCICVYVCVCMYVCVRVRVRVRLRACVCVLEKAHRAFKLCAWLWSHMQGVVCGVGHTKGILHLKMSVGELPPKCQIRETHWKHHVAQQLLQAALWGPTEERGEGVGRGGEQRDRGREMKKKEMAQIGWSKDWTDVLAWTKTYCVQRCFIIKSDNNTNYVN